MKEPFRDLEEKKGRGKVVMADALHVHKQTGAKMKLPSFSTINRLQTQKCLATIIASALLLWHLFATIVFLLPPNPLTEGRGEGIKQYISQYFYQNWHLFSPNPGIVEQKFWIRCKTNNNVWSEWLDPFAKIQDNAHSNRFAAYGKLLYLYRSLLDGLVRTYSELKQQKCGSSPSCSLSTDSMSGTPIFNATVGYVANVCENMRSNIDEIEFKVVRVFPFPYSKREEIGTRSFHMAEEINFKPIPVSFIVDRST